MQSIQHDHAPNLICVCRFDLNGIALIVVRNPRAIVDLDDGCIVLGDISESARHSIRSIGILYCLGGDFTPKER